MSDIYKDDPFKISNLIPLLQRFPQNSWLEVIGENQEDIRVMVPWDVCPGIPYFRVDEPDENLPWLNEGKE